MILLQRVGCAISAEHTSCRDRQRVAGRPEKVLQLEEAQLFGCIS